MSDDYPDLDPRIQRAASDLLAVGHAAWQDRDWSTSVDIARRLVTMLHGTSAHTAALAYQDALTTIQARRSNPTLIPDTEAGQHAEAMLTAWMHLRAALLPW